MITMIPLTVDVAGTVHVARNHSWEVSRLQQCMPDVPSDLVKGLLTGVYSIGEQYADGSFEIVEKGLIK